MKTKHIKRLTVALLLLAIIPNIYARQAVAVLLWRKIVSRVDALVAWRLELGREFDERFNPPQRDGHRWRKIIDEQWEDHEHGPRLPREETSGVEISGKD